MKFRYQVGGERGIIIWSAILTIFFLGVIIQMEIFKFNYLSLILIILSIIMGFFVILKSKIIVEKDKVIINYPFSKYPKKLYLNNIDSIKFNKYNFTIYFKSSEYFPLKIFASKNNVAEFSKKLKL